MALEDLHAVLGQMQLGGVLAQLLLVLRHCLHHLRQVPQVGLLARRHPLGLSKLLQLFGYLPEMFVCSDLSVC